MDKKLRQLLLVVKKETEKAEKNYLQAKKDASEVAASAALSPSQSGDRFHSEGAVDLAKQRLDSLKKLEAEIKFGSVRYIQKGEQEFFLVENVTLVPGIKFVSVDSPVGRKLT